MDLDKLDKKSIIIILSTIKQRTFLFRFSSALGVSMPKYQMEFTLEYN